jgi:hypothetical protein
MPPVARPAQSAPRSGSGGWWLLALIIGFLILVGHLPKHLQPGAMTAPVEVRRALPPPQSRQVEVRRALPVALRARTFASPGNLPPVLPYAQSQLVTMPDGSIVDTHYQGELTSSAALPPQGPFIGEEWKTADGTSWVWTTSRGASFPSWVDP